MMGAPAFVFQLIPIFSLKYKLLFDQRLKVITSIHQCNGFSFLLTSDNLRANEACFKMYQKNYGIDKIFACNHPIFTEALKSFICCKIQRIYITKSGTNCIKKSLLNGVLACFTRLACSRALRALRAPLLGVLRVLQKIDVLGMLQNIGVLGVL